MYPIEKTWFYNFALTEDQKEVLLHDYTMSIEKTCYFGADCESCKLYTIMVDYIVELENRLNNGN